MILNVSKIEVYEFHENGNLCKVKFYEDGPKYLKSKSGK
jgi:hypothetical protein